ncbi:MAG: histidine triad nucleotide-binding protein [Halarsenatibacteraceae bacterium]
MDDCIFCKIRDGEIDTELVYEDNDLIAFNDINAQAPVHLLVVPKDHIPSIVDVEDYDLIARVHQVAVELAEEKGLEDGFRIVNNCGPEGGQTVNHLHFHLLGGRQFQWPPG